MFLDNNRRTIPPRGRFHAPSLVLTVFVVVFCIRTIKIALALGFGALNSLKEKKKKKNMANAQQQIRNVCVSL